MRRRGILAVLLSLLFCLTVDCAAAQTALQLLCQQQNVKNPDVIAWLEIPGAEISEPVLCHPEDDGYYAKRSADGYSSAYGSLYIQAKYNAGDFSDPVTIIYGNSLSTSAPFGMLQELYSGSFSQCQNFYLHTQEATQEYAVFAAIPYSSVHILHYNNFLNERRYQKFFDDVFSTRALGMHLDEDNRPVAGKDRVLILSTGLRGDPLQRYLVMAKLIVK